MNTGESCRASRPSRCLSHLLHSARTRVTRRYWNNRDGRDVPQKCDGNKPHRQHSPLSSIRRYDMTLTYERTASGTLHTRWVSCPFCESGIGPQESFAQHYATCPNNPETQA